MNAMRGELLALHERSFRVGVRMIVGKRMDEAEICKPVLLGLRPRQMAAE